MKDEKSVSLAALAFAIVGFVTPADSASAQSVEQLRDLSIEQLANIEISSVSKSAEPLSDAPAAIYVISHDDIINSGAMNMGDILRLAPNLEVTQTSPSAYVVTARGLNGNAADQNFSDKLLVLVDGRSIYTPLFGGVYWDMQGVPPEDIERIEVISGPGATLYGANAVNGVINIITRKSSDTQGGVLEVGGGNLARTASLQYGGQLAPDLTYRIHAEGSDYSSFQTPEGRDAHDGWSKPSGGFRVDWTPPGDVVSLQGDIFHAQEDPDGSVGGRDLVATWQHQLDGGSSLQLLAYYDKESRFNDNGAGGFEIDTYDIELQHSFNLGSWNAIVWGAGDRLFSYELENTALKLLPPTRTLNLANVFAQDTISVTDRLKLTFGLKIEDEPYTGVEPMPSVRASWKATDSILLWGAISRAVRSATPIDRDLHEFAGPIDYLDGSERFQPEILTSYELGTRVQASSRVSFSVSGFYNIYDDLRTIGLTASNPQGLPLFFNNQAAALVYGVEVWGNYSVADWWRLSAGFNIQHEHIHFQANGGLAGLDFVADDPNHQASLRSSVNLGDGVTWDATLRYVGALHHPALADYGELDMRLGWKVTPTIEVSVAGSNLLHDRHAEFFEDGESDEIPRSFFIDTRWRF